MLVSIVSHIASFFEIQWQYAGSYSGTTSGSGLAGGSTSLSQSNSNLGNIGSKSDHGASYSSSGFSDPFLYDI
jgi:hypothetical protein